MLKRVSPRAANGTGRASLTFGVLLCIFCVAAYAGPPVITRLPSDPAGRYTFAGRLPAAMKDFDSINLLAVEGRPDRIAGEVVVKRPRAAPLVYKLVPTSLSGKKLTFRTQITGGVSYRFEGRLSKRRLPEAEGGYDVPLLEGVLVKFRGGRRLGEMKGEFRYEEFGD